MSYPWCMDVGEDNVSGVARTHLLRVPLRIPLQVPLRIAPPCSAPYPCSAIALHRHRAMFFLCSVAQKNRKARMIVQRSYMQPHKGEAGASYVDVAVASSVIDPCSMRTLSWIHVVCVHY